MGADADPRPRPSPRFCSAGGWAVLTLCVFSFCPHQQWDCVSHNTGCESNLVNVGTETPRATRSGEASSPRRPLSAACSLSPQLSALHGRGLEPVGAEVGATVGRLGRQHVLHPHPEHSRASPRPDDASPSEARSPSVLPPLRHPRPHQPWAPLLTATPWRVCYRKETIALSAALAPWPRRDGDLSPPSGGVT